jgi:threonine/homoserine/homoserine lactone efflux protein
VRSSAEFAIAAGVLTLIPGPDTLLTLRTTISAGRASGLAAAAGVAETLTWLGAVALLGSRLRARCSAAARAAAPIARAG